MIPVLAKSEAVKLDEKTISSGFNSEENLMNNAGKAVAKFVLENIKDPFNQKILVIAGKGNNGGDAVIVHSYLQLFGCNSTLVVLDESILNSWIFKKFTIPVESVLNVENFPDIEHYNLIIDGIFGIGLSRVVSGKYLKIIEEIIDHPAVIAIDIPSGIYCDSGKEADISVNAMATLTMGFPKIAHFINSGLLNTGVLDNLEIGFCPIDKCNFYLVQSSDISSRISIPQQNVNKFTRGKVVIIGGSNEYPGAVSLTGHAALKSGAGYVKVVVPESIIDIVNLNIPEAVIIPLNSIGSFNELLEWADSIVIGPGLQFTEQEMERFMSGISLVQKPVILDAGGFEIFNRNYSITDFPKNTILTPHIGELKKIFPDIPTYIDEELPVFSEMLKKKMKSRHCILKGQPNLIYSDNSEVIIMNNGTHNLATAGTGDVLSGILGTLTAQNYSAVDSMIIGSWIHAEAGNQFRDQIGEIGMTASDLLNFIPPAFETILDDR